jgi:hypothetical protein
MAPMLKTHDNGHHLLVIYGIMPFCSGELPRIKCNRVPAIFMILG